MPDLFARFKPATHLPPKSEEPELERVLALPRRKPLVQARDETRVVDPSVTAYAQTLIQRFRKTTSACQCGARFNRACVLEPNAIQAWALKEIEENAGLLGPIGVGDGKTLLDLLAPLVVPGCKTAVLLVQPNLRHQLTEVDWEFYGQHWNLPNLALKGPRWGLPGRPWLHVVAFTELSSAKSTNLLEQIKPDTIIIDEAHNLASDSSRTKRFARYLTAHPETRVCAWSGTITKRSLRDYAHLASAALKAGSPCPRNKNDVEHWCEELDPQEGLPPPEGSLSRAIGNWNLRLVETPGVVSSPEIGNCQASIVFSERKTQLPSEVAAPLAVLNGEWLRPDGEELKTALEVSRCRSELACGFYYRWKWPKDITKEEKDSWLLARKNWNKEVRTKLQQSKEFMDSPLLLENAAKRWHEGYTHEGKAYERHSKCGPLPSWPSLYWLEWEAAADAFEGRFHKRKPDTEPVWLSLWLAHDAIEWSKAHTGIVWYDHAAFADKIRALGGGPVYGGGEEASAGLANEKGTRSVFCSIAAHGTGKNLQAFSKNLVANPPSDGAAWEQLLGRTHRQYQKADEIQVQVYRHTPGFTEALEKARGLARYIQNTLGGSQKLLRATYLW